MTTRDDDKRKADDKKGKDDPRHVAKPFDTPPANPAFEGAMDTPAASPAPNPPSPPGGENLSNDATPVQGKK